MPGPWSLTETSTGVAVAARERHFDLLALLAVFAGVFDQVLENFRQFVAIALNDDRVIRHVQSKSRRRHPLASGDSASRTWPSSGARSTASSGAICDLSSSRDSDKEIVDKAAHARRLLVHDAEEFLVRLRVVARGSLQGFDETAQRGERRSQLMAGIGHEIRAHPVDAARLRNIAIGQDEKDARPLRSAISAGAPRGRYRRASDGSRSECSIWFALPVAIVSRTMSRMPGERTRAERSVFGGNGAEGFFGGLVLQKHRFVERNHQDRRIERIEDGGEHAEIGSRSAAACPRHGARRPARHRRRAQKRQPSSIAQNSEHGKRCECPHRSSVAATDRMKGR